MLEQELAQDQRVHGAVRRACYRSLTLVFGALMSETTKNKLVDLFLGAMVGAAVTALVTLLTLGRQIDTFKLEQAQRDGALAVRLERMENAICSSPQQVTGTFCQQRH